MENFEFKSQICTTKEQSERLLALGLKKETADMVHYKSASMKEWGVLATPFTKECVECKSYYPAWSLHRLLFLIPKEVNIDGFKFLLRSDVIMRLGDVDYIYEILIGIIKRVIIQGCFNKDYLEER